ncbi:MAG: hypothetical protein ACYC6N_28775 [Pirellulaceae bacterium]
MFPFRPMLWSAALLAVGAGIPLTPLRAQVSLPISGNRVPSSPLERQLASRVSLSFGQLSLAALTEMLHQQFSINVMLDHRALDDVGLGPESDVSATRLSGVVLEDALHIVLNQTDLTFLVRDEVLVITTPEEAENQLETRVYPVADLVDGGRSVRDIPDAWLDDYDTLIETITSSIAPDTWDEVGGAGSIESFPPSCGLVISQTRTVHRQIEPLLETLRTARSLAPWTGSGAGRSRSGIGSRPYVPTSKAKAAAERIGTAKYLYRPRGAWQEPTHPD